MTTTRRKIIRKPKARRTAVADDFEAIITRYAHQPRRIEEHMTQYNDLLRYNIAFLQSRLPHTFYYGARWGQGDDQNDHAEKSSATLIELQRHGVFTFGGQSDHCERTVVRSHQGRLRSGDVYTMKQRSYVEFAMPEECAERVAIEFIVGHHTQYLLQLQFPDGRVIVWAPKPFSRKTRYPITTEQVNDAPERTFTSTVYGAVEHPPLPPLRTPEPLAWGILAVDAWCHDSADAALWRIVKKVCPVRWG